MRTISQILSAALAGHKVIGILVVLMCGFIFAGCSPDQFVDSGDDSVTIGTPAPEFTAAEVAAIVDQLNNGDNSGLESFSDEKLKRFVDAMQEYSIYPADLDQEVDTGAETPELSSGLPSCSGYWRHYATAERIEERSYYLGLLYETGPNCVMWAPGTDCGTDHDDYMLSFYFGHHDESPDTLKSMLKWTSTSALVNWLMGTMSGRLHDQVSGDGADNYNVYVCVDDFFGGYLETFRMRKY